MDEPKKFVVQRHDRQNEPTHWDLMLESGGILETYRVGEPPEQWGSNPIEAVKIFDHPLKFLSYEGAVNNGKGSIAIADSGVYKILVQGEKQQQMEFAGSILIGEFTLSLVNKNK